MRLEHASHGSFVAVSVQIPLQSGMSKPSTLVTVENKYQQWRKENICRQPQSAEQFASAEFMSNWGIHAVWSLGTAEYARFERNPQGTRGFVHVPGQHEERDVLMFSGSADLFESSVEKIVEQLTSILKTVAGDDIADLDGPHPIFIYCGDHSYRLSLHEAPG